MILTFPIGPFFFTPAREVLAGGHTSPTQEAPGLHAAERMEYADVDFLLGLVEPKSCFSLVSWVRSLGW